jgi:hypothetical protein
MSIYLCHWQVTAEKVGEIPNVTYLATRKINLYKEKRQKNYWRGSARGTRHKK